jgi:SAM-dependent MidA family methyltransferase
MTTADLLAVLCDRSPLTFADYMDTVLYHPEFGYYNTATIGPEGDFFTAASCDRDFGELLAVQFCQCWDILHRPDPFTILEMGAGEGDTALHILDAIQGSEPEFYAHLNYQIVERSPHKRQRQQAKLAPHPVTWHNWDDIPADSIRGCCFSNELVDAFPVHQVVIQGGQLQEVYVTATPDGLTETVGPLSTPQLQTYFADLAIPLPGPTYPDGYRTEVNLAALDWLHTVGHKLDQGYLFTIDYGYSSDRYYHPQRHQGTLQAYYQHRHHNNPYVNLGRQDLTAHVNFTALEQYGTTAGLDRLGFTPQAMMLMALGLGDRLTALSDGSYTLPQILQRRSHLHQLINPTGLGGFGVLIQQRGLTPTQRETPLRCLQEPSFPVSP